MINTTLQLVLPCLGKIKILAAFTDKRIPVAAKAPTMGEIDKRLSMSLWNGLFVRKETPADVRAKIIAVAKATMASDRAQALAKKTGAEVYWQDADASAARIKSDTEILGGIMKMISK